MARYNKNVRTIHKRVFTFTKHEEEEKKKTGISSLKVSYNRVFGYYIEVTKMNSERVPEDYIRKQTLVNGERFITPELKEYEEKSNGLLSNRFTNFYSILTKHGNYGKLRLEYHNGKIQEKGEKVELPLLL